MNTSFFFNSITILLLASASAITETFTWAEIGNPGNAADSRFPDEYGRRGIGSVNYVFHMSAYETTNAQYVHFLNAMDPTGANTNGLCHDLTKANANGGIKRDSLAAKGAKYSVKSGYELLPVVYVSWNNAARFVNWLHNGAGAGSNTENGVYDMSLPQQKRVRQAGGDVLAAE